VVPAGELLQRAVKMAEDMCACVPQILRQYKRLIEDGYSMPYKEALAWERQRSIASAKLASAHLIEARRQGVLQKGRSEKA
jgi:enoyl-CoA hydratase